MILPNKMDKKIEFTLFFAKKFAHLEKKLLLLHANFKLIHAELIYSPLFPHSGRRKGDSDAALLRNSPECLACAKGILGKTSMWDYPQRQTIMN